MTVIAMNRKPTTTDFVIIHPLDDVQEKKVDVAKLGRMPLTASAKWALFALRGYLIVMAVLVAVKVLALAVAPKLA